jgi:hypothetical protein
MQTRAKNQVDSTESKGTSSVPKKDGVSKDSNESKKLISKKSEPEGSSEQFKELFETLSSDSDKSESKSATDEGEKPLKERKPGDVTPPPSPSEEGELSESEDDKPLKYRRKPKRGSAKSTEQRAVRKRDPNDVWDARNDPTDEELALMFPKKESSRDEYPHVSVWRPDYGDIRHHHGHKNADVWSQYENWNMARGKTRPRTYKGSEDSWKQFTTLYNQGEFAWGKRLRKLAAQTKTYKSDPAKQMLDMERLEREYGSVRSITTSKGDNNADRKRKASGDVGEKPYKKASINDLDTRSHGSDGRGYSPSSTPYSPTNRTDASSYSSVRSPSKDQGRPASGLPDLPKSGQESRTTLPSSEVMFAYHDCTPECDQRPSVECLLYRLWEAVHVHCSRVDNYSSMIYANEEKAEEEFAALKAADSTSQANLEAETRKTAEQFRVLREDHNKTLKQLAAVDRKYDRQLMEMQKQNLALREKNCSLMEQLTVMNGQLQEVRRQVARMDHGTSSTSPGRTPDSDASD